MRATINTILLLIFSINCFGQIKIPEDELSRIFYDLPIKENIETTIDSTRTKEKIKEFHKDYFNTDRPYFSGQLNKNDYLNITSTLGQIEIFRSNAYTLWGFELDSLDIIYVSYDFGDNKTKLMTKKYKELVKCFKKITDKNEKYKLYAEPGLIGYGFCFFKSKTDSLPFMSIELGLGNCVTDTKSLQISYYKTDELKN